MSSFPEDFSCVEFVPDILFRQVSEDTNLFACKEEGLPVNSGLDIIRVDGPLLSRGSDQDEYVDQGAESMAII